MKCVQLGIYGRVQGVYYRASTQKKAQSLGVLGWVRNCDDGSVSVLAVGEQSELDELILWCHEGPTYARVDRVSVVWKEEVPDFSTFDILR